MTTPTIHPGGIRGSQIPAVPEMKEQGRLERQRILRHPVTGTYKQMKLDFVKGNLPVTLERQYKQQQLRALPATLLGRRSWRLPLERRMSVLNQT